jgi:hypothetical protein
MGFGADDSFTIANGPLLGYHAGPEIVPESHDQMSQLQIGVIISSISFKDLPSVCAEDFVDLLEV